MTVRKAATVDDILGYNDKPSQEKMMGIMIYDGKTAGEIMLVPASQFKAVKSAMDRRGQQSLLRKSAPNGGRAI
jgi:hypothetical protein